MKKSMSMFFIALMLIGALTSCRTIAEQPEDNSDNLLAQMQEYRVEYVGDNSGVSQLLSFLPQFDDNYVQNMFAIQTYVSPYGITIYYEAVENSDGSSMVVTEEMTTYAGYLFECIFDLGYIEYAYRTTPSDGKLERFAYTILLKVDHPDVVKL